MGGWWSKVCQAPENWAPTQSVPHLGSPCSHGWAQPRPPRETAEPREGMADGALEVRTPLSQGQDGACPVRRQTQPRVGWQVWLVPAALTQPCGRLPPPSPLQEGPSWDLAPASSPLRQKHSRLPVGSEQGRDAVVLGLGREHASARHPAEPHSKACSPKSARRGCGNHTRRALGPRHLSPSADVSLASGHLTREALPPGQCTCSDRAMAVALVSAQGVPARPPLAMGARLVTHTALRATSDGLRHI